LENEILRALSKAVLGFSSIAAILEWATSSLDSYRQPG